jgi:hypothetical protein
MRFRKALFFTSLVSASPLTGSGTEVPAPAASPAPAKDPSVWVRELADEHYKTREDATRELWKMAEKALPVLEEAAKSTEPEQAIRARELLRKIRLHITPDTDPSVITLVEQYLAADTKLAKSNAFEKLKGKRAWLQLLKLYAEEKDEDFKMKLQPSISGIAARAAREKLNDGDPRSALAFLELAPEDHAGLLALAEYHRGQGTLTAELDKAKGLEDRKGKLLYLALLRSAGDTAKARDVADQLGEKEVAAAMAALSGDPLPWLKLENSNDPLVSSYHFAAIARWNSGKVRSSDVGPLIDALASKDPSERDGAINALFLLGETEAVLPTYIKADPVGAFADLESQERIPEALKALGLDPENPDFKPWVTKRFAQLTEEDIEDQHEVSTDDSELVTLASFLERRGHSDEAFRLFSGPATALAEKDSSVFLGLIGRLAGSGKSQDGAPSLAKRLGQTWAGDDPVRWNELVSSIFGDNEISADWWEWLEKLDPAAGRPQRLDALMALFDVGKDPDKLRDKWLEKAWRAIDPAQGDSAEKLQLLVGLAATSGDAVMFLKAFERLPEQNRSDLTWFQHIVCLTDVGRWSDAADIILKQIEGPNRGRQDAGADLHAYAAASLRKAGREQEALVHDGWVAKLALGDPNIALRVGHGYAFGCDYTRANEWWERAARLAAPDSSEFIQGIGLCLDHWMEKGRWREAASICEVVCAVYASREYHWSKQFAMLRQRVQGDTARALSTLRENRERSLQMLAKCHKLFLTDGSLADFFYPSLRLAGLKKEHDEWFDLTWREIEKLAQRYPESDNTRNTAGWLASRAILHLDDAEKLQLEALAMRPRQPAYLDTMAELQFAKGNREKAIEWSKAAVNFAPVEDRESEYMILRRQLERFQSAPLPKP